jgi:PAS domain-containing protein
MNEGRSPHLLAGDAVRAAARRRLQTVADGRGRSTMAGEILSMLYEMVSDPARQGDALALLHELRVHQDEIELQHEELEQTRRTLEIERGEAMAVFDGVPVALVGLGRQGRVLRSNAAAAELLSPGLPLADVALRNLWPAEQRPALDAALRQAWAGVTDILIVPAGPAACPALQLRTTRTPIDGEDLALWLALWPAPAVDA